MVNIFSVLGAFFSISAVAFYIIGTVGYQTSNSTYKNIPWLVTSKDSERTGFVIDTDDGGVITSASMKSAIKVGLRGGEKHSKVSGYKNGVYNSGTTDDVFEFSGSDDDHIKDCGNYGESSFGLIITALILAFFCFVLNYMLVEKDKMNAKLEGIVDEIITNTLTLKIPGFFRIFKLHVITAKVIICIFSVLSATLGVIGVTIFTNYCKTRLQDSKMADFYNDVYEYKYGLGSILATTGYALMFWVWLLSIANIAMPLEGEVYRILSTFTSSTNNSIKK